MRSAEIIEGLRQEFPGKNIILIPPGDPTEIICEVEPGIEKSLAIAYINRSEPHYHSKSQEIYTVEDGELSLHIAGRQYLLAKGDTQTVKPGKVHSASGNWARVRVESIPGWREEDHIFTSRR